MRWLHAHWRVPKRLAFVVLLASASFADAGPADAQSVNPVGVWGCNFGARDTSPRKRPTILIQFQMQVLPDGRVFGEGVQNEQEPMQFQGNWQIDPDGTFGIQGQRTSVFGPQFFGFASRILSNTQMASTLNASDGNIIATNCQRLQ